MVLLDEIEKAHPDLMNILLQVMDHATLTDNTGRKADFRQVILIMTSNAGSREMSAATIGFAGDRARDAKARGKQAIERLFTPEFRNRLDAIVTFKPLTLEVMETIVDKFVLELEAQLRERKVAIELTPGGAGPPRPQGLRSRLRRAAPEPAGADRGPQPPDRRDPVRPARARGDGGHRASRTRS